MTFKRSLLKIFIAIAIVAATVFLINSVFSQDIESRILERITSEIYLRTGIETEIEGIGISGIKCLSVTGITVSSDGIMIAEIPEITVSPGLSEIVKDIASDSIISVNVSIPVVSVYSVAPVLGLAGGIKKNSASESEKNISENGIIRKIRNRLKINFSLDSLNADIDFNGIKINSDKIRLFCNIGGEKENSLSMSSERMYLDVPKLGRIFIDDLSVVADDLLKPEIHINDILLNDDFVAEKLSVNAELGGKNIVSDISFEKATVPSCFLTDSLAGCSLSFERINSRLESKEGENIRFLFSSGILAGTPLKGMESISAECNLQADVPSLSNLKKANFSVLLTEIRSQVLNNDSSVSLSYNDNGNAKVSIRLNSNIGIDATYNISSGCLDISSTGDNVSIKEIADIVMPDKQFIQSFTKENSISGWNIKATTDINEPLLEGEVSADFNFSHLVFRNREFDSTVRLSGSFSDGILSVPALSVSAEGVTALFSGTFDILSGMPQGRLSAFRTDSKEMLGFISIVPESESMSFFRLTLPSKPLLEVSGTGGFVSEKCFQINPSVVNADSVYDFTIEADFSDRVNVRYISKGINLIGGIGENSVLYLNGDMSDISVKLNKGGNVCISSGIDIRYSLPDGLFNVSLDKMDIDVSDKLSASFNATVTNTQIKVLDVSLLFGKEVFDIVGEMTIESENMKGILNRDISAFDANINFSGTDGSYLKGSVHSGVYSLDAYISTRNPVRISLLGSEGSGFISDVTSGVFSFHVIYKNGVISIVDGNGQSGSIVIDDFEADLDFAGKSLESSFLFGFITLRPTGDIKRQCRVNISSAISSFSIKSPSIKDLDYNLIFNVDISEFNMSDNVSIPDTSFRMVFHNGILSVDGSLFNGFADLNSKMISLRMNETNGVGFSIKGRFSPELDLVVHDISVPASMANTFMRAPVFTIVEGLVRGDLMINGSFESPEIYGMLYCPVFKCRVFYLPDQIITVNNLSITENGKLVYMPNTPLVVYDESSMSFSSGNVMAEIVFQKLSPEYIEIGIELDEESRLNVWIPVRIKTGKKVDLNVRGYASGGSVGLKFVPGKPMFLTVDTEVSDLTADFKLPEMPEFFNYLDESIDMELHITMGPNVQFFYPSIDNSFINFTLLEGESVGITSLSSSRNFIASGALSFKTGRIFYFNNDFYITDGKIDLSPGPMSLGSSGLDFLIDLTAKISMYDVNGKPIDISLILNKANLSNFSPRFVSTPSKTENEILQILGNAILPSETEGLSLSYVASIAAMATQTITKLGLVESNSEGLNLSSSVKNTLGLDILSFRSSLLTNMIINALPGRDTYGNISIIARYLDGTSMFAGKNFSPSLFGKIWIQLNADKKGTGTKDSGHFLTDDLVLNFNMSMDWKNPMFTFTFFTQPKELSVFSFLDNIGFSITKSIRF